jgi:hypothetical protein
MKSLIREFSRLKHLLVAVGLWLGSSSQAWSQNEMPFDPLHQWHVLMEVYHVGYSKMDGERSYAFYPLDSNFQSITSEQSADYSFVWDFGHGRTSIEPFPVMTFDHHVPDKVTCRITAVKEVDELSGDRIPRPRGMNCDVTKVIEQELKVLRGRVERPDSPTVVIKAPPHDPVPGRCVNYAIEVTLPKGSKLTTDLTISGKVMSSLLPAGDNGIIITEVTMDPSITQVSQGNGALQLQIPAKRNATFTILLKCKLSGSVLPSDSLQWVADANFDPRQINDEPKRVRDSRVDRLAGSLDPSYFNVISRPFAYTGEMTRWKVTLENEGTTGEPTIVVYDKLPEELDIKKLKTVSGTWDGVPVTAKVRVDKNSRIVQWTLHGKKSLPPGGMAELVFEAPVIHSFPCPKNIGGCPDRFVKPLKHSVYVEFSNEQGNSPKRHLIECEELQLVCSGMKPPKIITGEIRSHCGIKTLAVLAAAGAAAFGIYKLWID